MKLKPRSKVAILAVLGTVALLGLVAGIVVWQVVDWDKDDSSNSDDEYILPPSNSELGVFTKAAVAADAPYCSDIGNEILQANGSIADAAIATMLCVGLIASQSMGIGGGFAMVYYDAASKTATTLNARERAPLAATQDMFNGDPEASARGKLAVAVPGEIKGYWELWKRYGKLSWKTLFEPTIKLAEDGFNVSAHAANALRINANVIKNSPTLAQVFVSNATGEVFNLGDTIKMPVLAGTLREIANAPEGEEDLLYRNSDLMRKFVADIRHEGGIITEDDMLNYSVSWDDPVETNIRGGFKVHSIPPPGSGLLLGFCMRLMSIFPPLKDNSLVTYQRLIESFKHAYAKRTFLGDPQSKEEDVVKEITELYENLTSSTYIQDIFELIHDDTTTNDYDYYGAKYYQPDDHGTSHMSIIAPNGDAISLTSTINLYYGAKIRSVQTGIIYNDEMDDFAAPNITNSFGIPPSKNNLIEPGKRPISGMTPAIFTDDQGKVRLVIGGAGGTRITTAVAIVAMKHLWFGDNIKEAIDARRVHHQLYPMRIQYEEGFDPRIIEGLQLIGHDIEQFAVGMTVIEGITVAANGTIYANSDFRKEGTVAGF